MKYCRNCGAELSEGANYCESCGYQIDKNDLILSSSEVSSETDVKNLGITQRNLVLAVILTILTCGIYSIYWQVKINDEMLNLTNKKGPNGVLVILYTILTLGIYGFFWAYKMGECVDDLSEKSNSMNVIFLILQFLGFGLVNMIIAQNAINEKVL